MNTPSNAMPEPVAMPAVAMSPTRPLYWSVRRELWESRSIFIAPIAAAVVALIGVLISFAHSPGGLHALSSLEPMQQVDALGKRYGMAAAALIFTSFIVGAFYCLDALHSERRERTILFWKSLPVSDFTTALSKAMVPLVVLPLVTFVIIVALHIVLLLVSTAILVPNGVSASTLWTELPLLHLWTIVLYGLFVLALWHAPIYGWLLLVSGIARRATFLWAVLPPLALCAIERIGFGTSHLFSLLKYRLAGGVHDAFVVGAHGSEVFPQLDPLRFLSSPGLWIGLAVAAAFFAVAVRLRRYNGPL